MKCTRNEVLVIGAGVSGLTTAVCLAEAGLSVRVRTREPPLETTSVAAGAIWGPYLVTHDRVVRWSLETLAVLKRLARGPGAGVELVNGLEAARTTVAPPAWATELADFVACAAAELPAGFVSGWRYTAPVVHMRTYLHYLSERLSAAGGKIDLGTVTSLEDASTQASVAVNCAGLGARELVPDDQVTPIRGQLVVVDNPGIDWFFSEHDEDSAELTYFLPQGHSVVLGGSAEPGRYDLGPDPGTSDAILRRCAAVEPRLARARIREHRVGVRPTRPNVRVERVDLGSGHLIHNYGHGGAGVTLSWGCAQEVLRMIRAL